MYVNLIRQETWDGCMPACLAMITNDSVDSITDQLTVPTPIVEAMAYLSQEGIENDSVTIMDDMTIEQLMASSGVFAESYSFNERTLILVVESPKEEVDWHAVVVCEGELYDPADYWDSLEDIKTATCTWGIETYV